MSKSRFSCLKPTETDNSSNKYTPPGSRTKFNKPRHTKETRQSRETRQPRQTNNKWKKSESPEKTNKRFAFLKKESNLFSKSKQNNNFNSRTHCNDRGGLGKFKYNRGRRGPSIFDNVKKDNLGRPMLAGAITSGFDIGMALQKSKNKSKKKREKNKKIEKKEIIKDKPKLVTFKKDEKTEEQLKAEADWNKQMILSMQYEWETDSEEEEGRENDIDNDIERK